MNPSIKCMAPVLAQILTLAIIAMFSTGFTFLSNPPAKLPATIDSPDVLFTWDGKAPPLSDKDTFRDGVFAGQSDEQVMELLILEAMTSWNNVLGSYLKLNLNTDLEAPNANEDDLVNVIVISETNNLNSAAFANHAIKPMNDQNSEIVDCDITIDTKSVTTEFMLYALTHELGHCLGLGHAHDNYQSIMGYSRTPGLANLSADDKAGIISLYGDPAYGDPRTRELIGIHCGTVQALGKSSPSNKFMWIALALPILLCMCNLRRWHYNRSRNK